ncbi:MAG: hypothetical protein ICCCNLDF_02832 [Planctomycetes bacterium]|nr:hypothetical protein [Planctomycetota bacterium]
MSEDIHHYRTDDYEIHFQDGPVGEVGRNGCQNEEIIEDVLLHRLRGLQLRFPCRENALAITKLEEALLWLKRRTELRTQQGVEGKNEPHIS